MVLKAEEKEKWEEEEEEEEEEVEEEEAKLEIIANHYKLLFTQHKMYCYNFSYDLTSLSLTY